jgi:hypothetical protein
MQSPGWRVRGAGVDSGAGVALVVVTTVVVVVVVVVPGGGDAGAWARPAPVRDMPKRTSPVRTTRSNGMSPSS